MRQRQVHGGSGKAGKAAGAAEKPAQRTCHLLAHRRLLLQARQAALRAWRRSRRLPASRRCSGTAPLRVGLCRFLMRWFPGPLVAACSRLHRLHGLTEGTCRPARPVRWLVRHPNYTLECRPPPLPTPCSCPGEAVHTGDPVQPHAGSKHCDTTQSAVDRQSRDAATSATAAAAATAAGAPSLPPLRAAPRECWPWRPSR